MSGTEPDDRRLLAGEYVLGVLSGEEMQAVRVRAEADGVLALEILGWEAQLEPLADAVAPVRPPDALWERLERSIAPPPKAANDDAPGVAVSRGRVRGWQAATAVSLALAAGFAALAFLPILPSPRPPAAPTQFAALAPIGGPAPAFVARVEGNGNVVLTAVAPAPVPAGRDFELWILRPGTTKVAPLGVLPASGATVHLPAAPATGTQLLISLEPAGGSPTGQPTGPVLYGGTLAGV